jgi:hypothetical protein
MAKTIVTKPVDRSAVTGRFVTGTYADRHPRTTEHEHVPVHNPKRSSILPRNPSEYRRVHFCQRAFAALRAISMRSVSERVCALARPPFSPPALRLDGCRFDSLTVSSASPMAISNTCFASWTGSRGRFAMNRVSHRPRRRSTL